MLTTASNGVLVDVAFPSLRSFSLTRRITVEAIIILGFAILVGLCAQIAIKIPTTTVPITGQTFGVLVAGTVLGSNRGAASMFVYMLLGLVGLPVFAPSSGRLSELISDGSSIHFIFPWSGSNGAIWDMSSGGYILGFVVAAYLVGKLAEKGWDRNSRIPLAMLIGNVSIYVFGLIWLGIFIGSGVKIPGIELTYFDAISGSGVIDKTLRGGLYPFIAGDALKLLLAMLAVPGIWSIVKRIKDKFQNGD